MVRDSTQREGRHSMASKRTNKAVPNTETGQIFGDGGGSSPSIQMPTKGGRNATTNEARRAAGQVAPRPQVSKQGLLGSSSATGGMTASMARVTDSPSGDSALRLPVSHPTANIANKQVGQTEADPGGPGIRVGPRTRTPMTGNPLATNKPKRKGLGAAFWGEYK